MAFIGGRFLSYGSSTSIELLKIYYIRYFYAFVVRSYLVHTDFAYVYTSFLLKLKIMTGSNCFSMMTLMILNKSEP